MLRHPANASTGRLSGRHAGHRFELRPDQRLIDLDLVDVIARVPPSVASEHLVLPIAIEADTIVFATPHETDVMLADQLRFLLNCNVRFISRDRREVAEAIRHHYDSAGEAADSMLRASATSGLDESDDMEMVSAYEGRHLDRFNMRNMKSKRPGFSIQQGNGMLRFTIPTGKRVLAYRRNGEIEVLVGPKRVWKGSTRFESMKHFIAHPAQYLSIRFLDGRESTQLGPCEGWLDPREHESIEIRECLDLAAKEAVVVYGPSAESDETEATTSRRIFHGPGLFAPKPGEWLHRFSWHASHGGSRGEEKRPNALQFQKLCMMPDQMYHDVRDVRTADDAVLKIRLMIFFELIDIDRMLDTTHDPIGDFINAATSDVVEFTGKRSFDEFKRQTELLNEISTYGQLLHRAKQCGYQINNVVYRGYGAPDSLQAMHDEAIQTRTRLQLEKATEQQTQEVEDYKLRCQMERSDRRREEQMTEVQHDLEMKQKRSEADLRQQEQRATFSRELQRAQREQELALKLKEDEQKRTHLESLSALRVDLTQYLTQGRADQVIELRGEGRVRPDIHLGNGKSPN